MSYMITSHAKSKWFFWKSIETLRDFLHCLKEQLVFNGQHSSGTKLKNELVRRI